MYLRSLDASRLIDDIGALRDVSLRNFSRVFPAAMSALDIVIVIRRRRRRQIRQLASLGLVSLYLPHLFHCVLQLLMLDLPFRFLLLAEVGLHVELRLLLHLHLLLRLYLHPIAFANLLVLSNPVRVELSPASSARNQIAAFPFIFLGNLEVVPSVSFGRNRFFFLNSLAKRSLIDIRLSDHGMRLAGLLMRHQRFFIEPPAAVLALNEGFLHECIVRFRVELVNVVLGDLSLRGEVFKAFGRLGAGPSQLGRF